MHQTKLTNKYPKVCIGLPTHNRAHTLKQAISSILNQDYEHIELVISDNASSDNTQKLCKEFSNQDKRIKYIRQSKNIGATNNFIEVLNNSSCEFFLWLSDDDWLDTDYISQCVKVLMEDETVSLVAGKIKYYAGNNYAYDGKVITIMHNSAPLRVFSYYSQVTDNGIFYGVMRKEQISRVTINNTIGGDWLIIAAIGYLGKLITLENTSAHRRLGGISSDNKEMGSSMNLSTVETVLSRVFIAINAFKDILWRTSVFQEMGWIKRIVFAGSVFLLIFIKKAMLIYIARAVRSILRKVGIWDRINSS